MKARPGDMLVIKGHRFDEPARIGEILEVRGQDGAPPYVVRWDDTNGHFHFVFPGPDAEVRPLGKRWARTDRLVMGTGAIGASTGSHQEGAPGR